MDENCKYKEGTLFGVSKIKGKYYIWGRNWIGCNRHEPFTQISHSVISLSVRRRAVCLPLSPTSAIAPTQDGHPASHGHAAIKS